MDIKNSEYVRQIVEQFSQNPKQDQWYESRIDFYNLINSDRFDVLERVDNIANIIYELDEKQFIDLQKFFGLYESVEDSSFNFYTLWVESNLKSTLNAKNLRKFEEHIKLSCHQRNFIKRNGFEAQKIAEEARDVVAEASEIKNKIYSEFIAILGIFTAISFLTMGSIQVLGDLFKGVGSPTPQKFGYALLIGGIYIVIMYVFIMTMFIGMRKVIGNTEPYEFTWGFCIFILIVSSLLVSIGLFLLNSVLPGSIILFVSCVGLIILVIKTFSPQSNV